MFGLSINKILFTVLLAVAVWRGFRFLEKLRSQRIEKQASSPRSQPHRPSEQRAKADVELAACPSCGTFGPRSSICGNCERSRHGG